ncbi:uncharacterized protein LOC135488088 [Lineus longissimus]|uniref:uncharacterized protein LOC135488088 n=1 Tax=Lineus longissimus TaxID=88925 RepID=UPI002B4CFD3A
MCNKMNVPSTNLLASAIGLAVVLLGTAVVDATLPSGQTRQARPVGQARQVRYEHFDDYLMSMSEDLENQDLVTPARHIPESRHHSRTHHRGDDATELVGRLSHLLSTSDDEDVTEGSGSEASDGHRSNTVSAVSTPSINILAYFRDVPREHWSCCMLGVLSGDKGFHCQASFYAARIVLRNRNRSHNRRMPFHGHNRNPTYGKDIMYHFQGCVERRAAEFHKCCYAATLERMEMDRWRRYRDFVSRTRGN